MSTNIDDFERNLRHDFEIEQYIDALAGSSSRVRFVMLAVIIAAAASAAMLWSERSGSWERARLVNLTEFQSIANNCNVWVSRGYYKQLCSYKESGKNAPAVIQYPLCPKACEAFSMFDRLGIDNKKAAEAFANQQREAFIDNVLYVKMPVLGLIFDVNDLGLITGITFFILMLVMVFYTHRAHENLALCMWKVRQIAEAENCFDEPGSRANLLYHALAMQQVFTVPPTLARWRDMVLFRGAHYLLFFLPLIIQGFIFANDLDSFDVGAANGAGQARYSLAGQLILFPLVAMLCVLCFAHIRADDSLWRKIFYDINPAHQFKGKQRWLHWIQMLPNESPAWGLVGLQEGESKPMKFCVFVADSVLGMIWKFDLDDDPDKRNLQHYKQTSAKGLYLEGKTLKTYYDRSHEDAKKPVSVFKFSGATYRAWPRKIEKEGVTPKWEVGGAQHQLDEMGKKAGFEAIRAVIQDGDDLLVTDGAWVRRIKSTGYVEALGGQPLNRERRREKPLLLGIDVWKYQPVKSDELPEILICDFLLSRVVGMVSGVNPVVVYESEKGWSPAGIWVSDDNRILLLEYRQASLWGELATFIQSKHCPVILSPLARLLKRRKHLRVIELSHDVSSDRKEKFQLLREIIEISPTRMKSEL